MKSLYIDCRAGMAGDMFLAAFAHLGVDFAPFKQLLKEAGIPVHITVLDENRAAGAGKQVRISYPEQQPLRHLHDLVCLTQACSCSFWMKEQAIQAFTALAEAEAAVHSCSMEEVHFHEVGALDTFADVLGTFYAIEQLGITSLCATPLPWFSGTVHCDHGEIPLPAPATLKLMQGFPVVATDMTFEAITPTGALLFKQLVAALPPSAPALSSAVHKNTTPYFTGPSGSLCGCGTGYGNQPYPRGLRLVLTKAFFETDTNEYMTDSVVMLESHIDHLTGEELGHALQAIMDDGAVDVLWLPGLTKKNRPGGVLRVLCKEVEEDHIRRSFFRHTHTLGIRRQHIERVCLPRMSTTTRYADTLAVTEKAYCLEGRQYARMESDDARHAANVQGVGVPAIRLEKNR